MADGAPDNWSFFAKELPPGGEVLDFYHAAEHLKRAMDVIHGERSRESLAAYRKYRDILLNDTEGVTKLIRHLRYQVKKHPQRKSLKTELVYFTRHQKHCQYATAKADNLPIGSGVIEAACKTLVQQRLKRSGMRWDDEGGQAMLSFRGLLKSGRFDAGWKLLADTYRQDVVLPSNVLQFRPK